MSGTVRVYCPNHGLIATIETDVFYKGRPPMPEIDNAYCPKCGAQTTIKRSGSRNCGYSWTLKDDDRKYHKNHRFGIERL